MSKVHAVITAVGGYLPDYILNNHELSTMMDTSDEWITTRIGIKERRILKKENTGTSYMAAKAVEEIFEKTGVKPEEIDVVICATSTPDYIFPATAAVVCERVGIKGALAYDLQAACSGFIVGLTSATAFVESGRFKKALVIGAEKMSSITNYEDRATAPIFGDGAAAVLVEPTNEELGVMDAILHTDSTGIKHLHMKAGGSMMPASHETVDNKLHYVYQEGQAVFKNAVYDMAEVSAEIMERNNLTGDDISWLIPHQANLRIIDAVQKRTGVDHDKVLINIEHIGNTSAASIPIGLWEMEKKFKKGDNIILTAFGAGFTWGAIYLKWGY
ncbi:ketoacyl-ACP synthase III [Paludibacter sp. 221]|uniref:beta-ketoacyl-ACP synthase III n=1 Tax=Paludibacter sp. 221 TaxID=2302939 RepID=UPI0013CFD83C|nr:beta-ketoacyl-ACP synthase III [Paludibacter sp. 221]NDV45451.1 ketoacyl-ACP synthase III [Paludibacter sp. 221]